jgi:regulator of replication initiation timing
MQYETKLISLSYESFDDLQQTRQYMDSSDEKTLMESLDPVIVELLKENVRLRGEIDRLKERLDNKKRFFFCASMNYSG